MLQEFVDVRFTGDGDVAGHLVDINAIERSKDPFVAEVNLVLCADDSNKLMNRSKVMAANGEVINLARDQHLEPIVDTNIEAALVGGRLESVAGQDPIDQSFSQGTGLRVTLEGVLDGEHLIIPQERLDPLSSIPIRILCIDVDKRGLIRRRELAYALVASILTQMYPSWAQSAKNIRMHGCSMHEEYVFASFNSGAARGDPSQQFRALRVPSDLME